MKRNQAGQNCHSFSLVQAEEEERSASQNSLPSGRASLLPHFYSVTVPVYGWQTGSWPATTEVPSNVLLCILSAKDYFCAKQETDQPLCQEQQIPCSLSSLPSLPKVQTRSLCVFTHTPEWTSASFLELVERVGKMVFNKHSLFPKQTHFVMD